MQTHGGMFGGEREMKQALTELNLDVTHGDLFGLEGGGGRAAGGGGLRDYRRIVSVSFERTEIPPTN